MARDQNCHGGALSVTPSAAQITICGALSKDAIAALVEVAMAAGAALMVQPSAPRPVPELPPAADVVVQAVKPRRRYTPRVPKRRKVAPVAATPAPPVDARVQRALRNGPLLVGEFLRATGLDKVGARRLVKEGAIVATGVTRGRRYALPGAAKEAP